MREHWKAALLTIALLLALAPVLGGNARADISYNLWLGETEVTDSATSGDGWSYAPGTHTLTLNGYSYTGVGHNANGRAALYYDGTDPLHIELVGNNALTLTPPSTAPNFSYGIFSTKDVTFSSASGTGKLNVTAGTATDNSYGAFFYYCGAEFTGGSLTFTAGSATHNSIGILSYTTLTVSGGSVKAVGSAAEQFDSAGIFVNNSSAVVAVSGGRLEAVGGTATDGISTGFFSSVNVTGGEVVAYADDVAIEEHKTLTVASGMTVLAGSDSSSVEDVTAFAYDTYKNNEYIRVFQSESPAPPPTPVVPSASSSSPPPEPFSQSLTSAVPSSFDGGKVAVSPADAGIGDKVTLTATPDEGMRLASLTVDRIGGDPVKLTDEGNNVYSFRMPGWRIAVNAQFEPIPAERSAARQEPAETAAAQPAQPTLRAGNLPGVVLSPQRTTVNGAEATVESYNIGGTNYFSLRDLAALLSGTPAQFNVEFDADRDAVVITRGATYNGAVNTNFTDRSGCTVPSYQTVFIDGVPVSLTAYNIGGNNFYGLRELSALIGYSVSYDEANNTAVIEAR